MRIAAVALLVACGGPPPPPPRTIGTTTPPRPPAVEATWDQLDGPVIAFAVAGIPSLQPQIGAALKGVIGKPLDRGELRAALDRIALLSQVADASVRGKQVDGGVELLIDLVPQDKLAKIVVHRDGKEEPVPVDLITLTGAPFDPARLDAELTRMGDRLRDGGYYDTGITWTHRAGVVDIAITQGQRYVVDHVELTGNTLKTADLVAVIHHSFSDGDPYQWDRVQRGELELEAYYWDHGFANVRVAMAPPTGPHAPVIYAITEGPVFHIGTIAIKGLADTTLAKRLPVKTGGLFSRSEIIAARTAVETAAKAVGMVDPNVLPLTKVDIGKKLIDLTFEVTAAPSRSP